jgi:hypothetical protein
VWHGLAHGLIRTLTGEMSSRSTWQPGPRNVPTSERVIHLLRRLLQLPPFDYLTRDIDKRPMKAVSWEICVS